MHLVGRCDIMRWELYKGGAAVGAILYARECVASQRIDVNYYVQHRIIIIRAWMRVWLCNHWENVWCLSGCVSVCVWRGEIGAHISDARFVCLACLPSWIQLQIIQFDTHNRAILEYICAGPSDLNGTYTRIMCFIQIGLKYISAFKWQLLHHMQRIQLMIQRFFLYFVVTIWLFV